MTVFNYDGVVLQQYTVTKTGVYQITVEGAAGGQFNAAGGMGAEISGDIQLQAGQVLDLLIGGVGQAGVGVTGAGGGGASFVEIDGQSVPLIVAAGGGGAYNGTAGEDGQTFGTGASSGGLASGFAPGGGGGGFNGAGRSIQSGGQGGGSLASGGAGGVSFDPAHGGNGGFGGGGGGGFSGGGGGGYKGGDSGEFESSGYGGYSFISPSMELISAFSGVRSGAGEVTISCVCFAAGTRIATPRGQIAIEHLAVGDLVLTASGEARPIRWLGHRRVDLRAHPRPAEVMPVRIAADAFGPGRPARDLYVSAAHALGFDVVGEVLVPAGQLLNGATIDQVDMDSVVYWHVELDSHDLLLAENLPAESYIEAGNREFFAENAVVALRAALDGDAGLRDNPAFCRPFHVEGPLVEALRQQTRRRAGALGWRLEHRPVASLHLVVDGVRVEPKFDGPFADFRVAAGAREVWLVSEASRPCDVGDSQDERRLGVAIASVACDDGSAQRWLSPSDPRLVQGFYEAEASSEAAWRWTSGRARLPRELWASCRDRFSLIVELAADPPARWTAPEGDVMRYDQRRA